MLQPLDPIMPAILKLSEGMPYLESLNIFSLIFLIRSGTPTTCASSARRPTSAEKQGTWRYVFWSSFMLTSVKSISCSEFFAVYNAVNPATDDREMYIKCILILSVKVWFFFVISFLRLYCYRCDQEAGGGDTFNPEELVCGGCSDVSQVFR